MTRLLDLIGLLLIIAISAWPNARLWAWIG